VAQKMIYIGICSVDTWKKYVFCCWLDVSWWLLSSSISLLMFSQIVLLVVEKGVLKSPTIIMNLRISLWVLSVLIHTFFILLSAAYTCRICYLFLIYLHFYHYIISTFVLIISLALKSTLSDINIVNPIVFWLMFYDLSFSILLLSTYQFHYIWSKFLSK